MIIFGLLTLSFIFLHGIRYAHTIIAVAHRILSKQRYPATIYKTFNIEYYRDMARWGEADFRFPAAASFSDDRGRASPADAADAWESRFSLIYGHARKSKKAFQIFMRVYRGATKFDECKRKYNRYRTR